LTGYIIGASNITVEMDQKDRIPLSLQAKISQLTKGLLGFSIVEQDSTRIEIRDLSQSSEIKATMKQMLVKVGLVFEQLIEILAGPTTDTITQLELLVSQDDTIDEYRYQIDRQTHLLLQNPSLSRQMEVNPVECLHFAQCSRSLERIADHLVNIGHEVMQISEGNSLPTTTISLLRRAYNYYILVIDLFYKSDAQELHRVLLEKEAEMNDYSVDGENITDKQVIMHLDRIVHHCADILEYRINSAIFAQLS
jgi:phosphate uptake regulator